MNIIARRAAEVNPHCSLAQNARAASSLDDGCAPLISDEELNRLSESLREPRVERNEDFARLLARRFNLRARLRSEDWRADFLGASS